MPVVAFWIYGLIKFGTFVYLVAHDFPHLHRWWEYPLYVILDWLLAMIWPIYWILHLALGIG